MRSINQEGPDVNERPLSYDAGAHSAPVSFTAGAESVVLLKNGVSNTGGITGKLLFAGELKERISFEALLKADGHQLKRSGKNTICRCPFHADRTPSFVVTANDTHGKCYGCDWYGNVFDYEMEFNKVDFKTAWVRLNNFCHKNAREGRKAKPARRSPALSKATLSKHRKAAHMCADRLAGDSWLAKRICDVRREYSGESFRSETIQQLAAEGSLGWAGDALAFIYPTGIKYRRWPRKEFVWDCEGLSLWREGKLAGATHVYLTESETDAIALIDAGTEAMPGTAVLALPSATSFQLGWADRFAGKTVTLCFDNDEAGAKALQKIAPLLAPYVSKLLTIDLKEVA